MPKVRMYDMDQYVKAIEVLDRVGGTYHGVGRDEWYLLVNDAQYKALLKAKVIRGDDARAPSRGKRRKKSAKP